MKNTATVEKIENNCVVVSYIRRGACGENCAVCNSCTAQKIYTKAYCDIKVDLGDSVIVESSTISVLCAMFFVFILPLVLPLTIYLVFSCFSLSFSVIGVFAGVIISCIIIFFLSRSDRYIKNITPKIVAISNKK